MKFDLLQGLGVLLLVLGAQGAIRLLIDHDQLGLLGGLDAGFGGTVAMYVVAVVAGAVLAGWARDRAKALGRRK
ncbi:hypothetical protein FGD71_037020 [Streptomyces sporangiiformans]|uniref:Uncharacterized protein n=1 Tax=Streptomyces sporangiiformans TaxID=2315329 RepID=A0A505D6F7_9ACTN|nr:hypothetical protein FGD71_037020 [Streptomyces sporangiiformans]